MNVRSVFLVGSAFEKMGVHLRRLFGCVFKEINTEMLSLRKHK